jgi:hypothetical protein
MTSNFFSVKVISSLVDSFHLIPKDLGPKDLYPVIEAMFETNGRF